VVIFRLVIAQVALGALRLSRIAEGCMMPRKMKRANYRDAISWIACNDDAGGPGALNFETVRGYTSVCLIADLFGVEQKRVARDVVRYRGQGRSHPDVDRAEAA
jgi:hypothetical protein